MRTFEPLNLVINERLIAKAARQEFHAILEQKIRHVMHTRFLAKGLLAEDIENGVRLYRYESNGDRWLDITLVNDEIRFEEYYTSTFSGAVRLMEECSVAGTKYSLDQMRHFIDAALLNWRRVKVGR